MRRLNRDYLFPLLTIFITTLGAIGSLASISSVSGWWGVAVSVVLSLIIIIVLLRIIKPVYYTNSRGVSLIRAIKSVGLVDIENREDKGTALPPTEIYLAEKNEIFISGISAYRTFDQHISLIKQVLNNNKHNVYIMIIDPKSKDLNELTERENKRIKNDINSVLEVIKSEKLTDNPLFEIRFFSTLPPFTAVMIDGDVNSIINPLDEHGVIRVQPATRFQSQHAGLVLKFKKEKNSQGLFDYFAEDLRKQWNKARHLKF